MTVMHPSKRFKVIAIIALAIAAVSAFALAFNKATFQSEEVTSIAQIGLLFACNLCLALPARLAMMNAAQTDNRLKAVIVGVTLGALVALLFVDSLVVDYTAGDEQGVIASTISTVVTATIWIVAYVISWKPFLKSPDNQFAAASVSLALVSLSLLLYFVVQPIKPIKELFGATSAKLDFAQFALACISMSSAISAFIIQWNKRSIVDSASSIARAHRNTQGKPPDKTAYSINDVKRGDRNLIIRQYRNPES